MYALNVLVVSHQPLQEIEQDRKRYRAIYADSRERAVERMQATDLDLVLIDESLPQEDKSLVRRLIEIQQPAVSVIETNIETLAGLRSDISQAVKAIHDNEPKNTLVLQETSLL